MPILIALRSGHWPSLLAAWLHFEISFMTWVLVGALGGFIADRLGGLRVLSFLYPTIGVFTGIASLLLPFPFVLASVLAAMTCLGMGNGVIFQVVPQRFRREIGAISGLVGAAGGVGGFLLPSMLGLFRDLSGTYATGFALFAAVCVLIVPVVVVLWRPRLPIERLSI